MLDIFQSFASGFYQVLAWSTLSLMMIGIAVGFVVGILPGLGGPTTLAIMLPFIFRMSAVQAFAFLLGMSAVTATTGDITSVLFGVPGEPTTASTIVDGHPMAKKGEAGRALGAVLMSSLVGAIVGAFALALAVPIVRPLVLSFGSPEFFMLALLGVTFVATLSGEAILKGIISGGIGFMLATVGLDPISGIQRFTFNQLYLWDGVGLVPVTVGLFAIPEIIDLAVHGGAISKETVGRIGGVMQGVKDTFHHFWLVIRCSAIGTYIGIIPGMGGAVSQWISYAHAVQSSPDKDRFGKGAIEGVLGPGAANNSTLGGSLIPTIAFGVPGSVTTAILLGAFIIQGIVPGPDMLIPSPKGKLDLTFSFVWIIVLSNLITVSVCFLFINQLAKITRIRSSLLMPFILLLVYLGAFAEKNTFQDVGIVLLAGGLGWVMVQLDWQRPPLILGLVLGPLMENRLFLSTDNYGAAWLWRPWVLIFGAITLFGIFYPVVKEKWRNKNASNSEARAAKKAWQVATDKEIHWGTVVFSMGLIFCLAWALWESRTFGFRAGLFPWAIGYPLLLLSVLQLVLTLLGRDKGTQVISMGEFEIPAEPEVPPSVANKRTTQISLWIVAYFLAIWFLGFSYAVPLMIFAHVKFGAAEKWPLSLALTAGGWAFFYLLFERSLHVPFPPGLIFDWLA
jgi:putative tricarboxylic transport membrane protein